MHLFCIYENSGRRVHWVKLVSPNSELCDYLPSCVAGVAAPAPAPSTPPTLTATPTINQDCATAKENKTSHATVRPLLKEQCTYNNSRTAVTSVETEPRPHVCVSNPECEKQGKHTPTTVVHMHATRTGVVFLASLESGVVQLRRDAHFFGAATHDERKVCGCVTQRHIFEHRPGERWE